MTPADITAAFDRIREEMARIDLIAPLTPADREFAWLAQTYRHAPESARVVIRSLAPIKDSPLFWTLTSRAAELALWDSDPVHLEDALAGHCIEDFKADPRENLRGLPFIWYAAEQLNSSAETLFAEAAKLASPTAREFLVQFAGRPKAHKTPEATGCEAVELDGRIRFRPLPPPWSRPSPSRKKPHRKRPKKPAQ
jgi:hypothetical protein